MGLCTRAMAWPEALGLIGQLLEDGVVQGRANKIDVGVQAGMRVLSNAADRVPGRDQLPCDQTPDCAGGVGNQDLHLGSPPPSSTLDNRRVVVTSATATPQKAL